MNIVARCHPKLESLLPKPVPARKGLPQWLREMPAKAVSPTLGGEEVRTLKHCPPFLDAMSSGLIMPLPSDITIRGNEVMWDWDFPVIEDAPVTRSPIGMHVPEQVAGSPFDRGGSMILKFNTFWALEAPPGWSLLFTHPFNRTDLPFQTLTGLVDSDNFSHGYVHFPVLLEQGFEGKIAKGTPVAQVIALPRSMPGLSLETMDAPAVKNSRQTQDALGREPGIYRKEFRHK